MADGGGGGGVLPFQNNIKNKDLFLAILQLTFFFVNIYIQYNLTKCEFWSASEVIQAFSDFQFLLYILLLPFNIVVYCCLLY